MHLTLKRFFFLIYKTLCCRFISHLRSQLAGIGIPGPRKWYQSPSISVLPVRMTSSLQFRGRNFRYRSRFRPREPTTVVEVIDDPVNLSTSKADISSTSTATRQRSFKTRTVSLAGERKKIETTEILRNLLDFWSSPVFAESFVTLSIWPNVRAETIADSCDICCENLFVKQKLFKMKSWSIADFQFIFAKY